MGKFKVGDKVKLNDAKLTAIMKRHHHDWYYLFKEEHKGTDVFTIKDVYPFAFYTLEEDYAGLFFKEEWLEALEVVSP